MKGKFNIFAQFSIVALLAVACTSDPDSAGVEYMPDMYRSPAIEPYVDYGEVRGRINDDMKMRRSSLTPPRFTIPYVGTDSATIAMMLPYHRLPGNLMAASHGLFHYDISTNSDADFEYKASGADMNPIKLSSKETSEKIFAEGKALYTSNCAHCHGEKGDGNGPMVVSGAYSGAAVLSGLTIPEGTMFYSIYYGRNMMGAHGATLNKKEIWTLVHYIKRFQNKDYGMFDANGKPIAAQMSDSLK
jgi:mono/diheme cytochrome c family protein